MRVFADTFYWIALTNCADHAHDRAVQFCGEIVTTDEVLTEYLTFFCAAPELLRHEVALAVEDILQDPAVKVIPQSRESFLAGLKLYRRRPDKGYSPHGLRFDANHAAREPDGSAHQRPPF